MGLLSDGNQPLEVEQPQYQQQEQQYPQFLPQQGFNQNPDIIKYRLESEDLLDSLEHDLKGEAWINKEWKPLYSPWLNREGISLILSIASRYINRGSYLGNLSTEQINFKCRTLANALNMHMFKYYRLYDVESRTKSRLLIRKVVDMIHLSLSRSQDAFESQEIGKSTNVQNIKHEEINPQQQQGGIFSMMRFGQGQRR